MSNWIIDLFVGKKPDPKEIFADRDSIIPKYLRKAALTEMETAEEDLANDWHSRVHNVSDFVLAEQITELELAGKGAPEKYNAHWQEVMGDIRKNRTKAEERLLKLVPRHSLLDVKEFFNRIKKQNDKFEVAKDRAINKRADLSFTPTDKLVAKGTSYKASVLASDVDYNIYAVKMDFAVNYYGGGDAHETFEKVSDGLEKEAAKTYEPVSRNVLETKGAQESAWQEVISSPLLKDIQIRAEYLLLKTPGLELRVQALEEPLFHEGEVVSDATGNENAEVLQVDKENGMYVMKIPGFPTPVRKTFEKAHAGFHAGKKPYLPGIPQSEPKEIPGPESLPKSKTEYISEDERAKLVKMRKEIEETKGELAGAQEYSRHWQDLTRKLQDLEMRQKEMSENKILEPGMPENRPVTPAEEAFHTKEKEEAAPVAIVPHPSKKLEPEGWTGWPNTVQVLKPTKHKKTNQGFELSLVANSLTLSLPNGSFLTSVLSNEQEAETEFDKADSLDSLSLLFPLAALEGFEKKANKMTPEAEAFISKEIEKNIKDHKMDQARAEAAAYEAARRKGFEVPSKKTAEDMGTGGPNMDGSNVMVDPQRGGVNQMGEGVEENPEPFKKKSDDEAVEEQMLLEMDELLDAAGGAEAVIQKAMAEGAKTREEIARKAVMDLIGDTHEIDFDMQMSARGPNSSAQGEPEFSHYNKKFSAAEVVPFMEKALDEFLPEKETKSEQAFDPSAGIPSVLPHASLEDQTFVVGENVILNSTVGALGEGTEVRVTGVVGASLAFEALHDPRIVGITKFAKVDKQKPLEKYEWDNDGIKVAFELGDHVKVSAATFLNGKALKGREGTVREKVIFSSPDAEVTMFYLVEFDGAECTTLPGDCLKRGSTKTASFLGPKEATLEVVSIIVKRPNGWFVKTHDGKRNLGGPYHSRERAEKRLQQVEMFKHMASVDKQPWLVPEGTPAQPESAEFAANRARFLRDKEIEELKKQNEEAGKHLSRTKEHMKEPSISDLHAKTAVLKPNLDVAQDFLDSFKIPPTVVSDIMIQEFLQKSNLHASKNDLNEIYKILQSSGVEVRISLPKEEVTAPTAQPAPEPVPKKKSSNTLADIQLALNEFHASDDYKAMVAGTMPQRVEGAKEDPTDTEEAKGLKVGSKVQYVVKSEDELPGIKPGTAITGKIILMPIQHPEKDMSSGQPKEQGASPIVTATVMWDKEDLGTSRGLLPEELTKIAVKYKAEVTDATGNKTVVEKEMVNDMGDKVLQDNPDGSTTEFKKAELVVEAKGENAKIRDLKKRLEKENKPSEISALINAIDALSGYVTKGKEAREKRRKDKADKAAVTPETAKADKAEVLAEVDDQSAEGMENGRGVVEVDPEPMGDKVPPLKVENTASNAIPHSTNCPAYYSNKARCECERLKTHPCTNCDGAPDGGHTGDEKCFYHEDEVKASEEKECCTPREPGFHNDECPEHIEWLKQQKALEIGPKS